MEMQVIFLINFLWMQWKLNKNINFNVQMLKEMKWNSLYFISTDEWVGWKMGVGNINKKKNKKKEWENYCQEIHCCVLLLLAYLILSSQQIYKIVFPFLSNIDHHLIYIQLLIPHSNIIYNICLTLCYLVYIGKMPERKLFLYLILNSSLFGYLLNQQIFYKFE